MKILLLFAAATCTALALVMTLRNLLGFVSQDGSDYMDNTPALDLPRHLSGEMLCEGMIFGPTGRVTSRFTADLDIVWDGPRGVMSERFHYDDGTTQDRQWNLILGDDGSVRAEASDVIGVGIGRIGGNALGLRYRIQLPRENGGHVLDAVDWMYVTDRGVILNRSQFRKFGIKVAELFCTMRPKETRDA